MSAAVAGVIMAPICEEILFRTAMVRPIHDHLARAGKAGLGAGLGIAFSAVVFAMPHLGDATTAGTVIAYLVTGSVFGIVYVLTGSLTAAMVSHSLQSAMAFGQILFFGRGDHDVAPIVWVLVLGCPLWVFVIARCLYGVSPHDRSPAAVQA